MATFDSGRQRFSAASATAQASSDFRRHDGFRQRVHIHVSHVASSFAPRNDGARAVLAHVRQRDRRAEILAASVGHHVASSLPLNGSSTIRRHYRDRQ
jgi:hypothetical protein